MRRCLPSMPSPATAIALTALVVALCGTGYAAIKLPAASVGTKQLKKGAVTATRIKRGAVGTAQLAEGAVNGAKVVANSLTGANIDESTLAKVPAAAAADLAANATSASHAATADSATTAGTAMALGSVTYAFDTSAGYVTVAPCGSSPCEPDKVGTTFAIATCPTGMVAIGGGGVTGDPGVELAGSFPTVNAGRSAWEVDVDNYLQTMSRVDYYAVCAVVSTVNVQNQARAVVRHR